MKNRKKRRSLIAVVGVLLALCLAATVLAKPFVGNTARWPELITSLSEEVLIPGYKDAIRKVKRFMEDEESLSKSSQKIMRANQEKRKAKEEKEEADV